MAAGIILSVVLMLQLYTINETVDVTSLETLLGRNMVGLMLVASYLLTTAAMLIIVSEFFQTKKRIDGLMAMTDLINRIEALQSSSTVPPRELGRVTAPEQPAIRTIQVDAQASEEAPPENLASEQRPPDISVAEPIQQLNVAATTVEGKDNKPSYKTLEVKLSEDEAQPAVEPQEEDELDFDEMDSVSQQRFLGEDDEQERVNEMLKHSEVISTLSELERIVAELKSKKGTYEPR